MSHHYFFAVPLPMELKSRIKKECDQLSKSFPFQRWVYEEDYHITLAFLGAAKQEMVLDAISRMKPLLLQASSFTLALHFFGTFGNKHNPRIFWLGIEKSPPLQEIQSIVFDSCKQAGFQLETRPFSPHITVARKWIGEENFDLSLLKDSHLSDTFTVDHIVLYETHLQEKPKYKVKAKLYIGNDNRS